MVKLFISPNLSSKNFLRKIVFKKGKAVITLKVNDIPLTMDAFPNSRKVLRKFLPSIFKCKCYNPKNQSFYKESKNTEIAHLLEHILLEFMCMEKVRYTDEISYSGKTSWNQKKMTGYFKVEIECSLTDYTIFTKALDKSIKLMDLILADEKVTNLTPYEEDRLYDKTVFFDL